MTLDAKQRERLGIFFEHALRLPPPARADYLAEACAGDNALHAEIASLLAAHTAEPDYLDRLADDVLAPALDALAEPFGRDGRRVGRYVVRERLGSGGMGVVYKAHDLELDRPVALKMLPAYLTADADARARLQREARAASALDHPHIVTIYEIGTAPDGGLFIAMGYYEGRTLDERIADGPLEIEEAVGLARQLADGLAAAHRRGVIHRDLKPANVIVTPEGAAKILDFGVAKTAGTALTRAGTRLGTVAYMSPEQTRGDAVDHQTDLWALGAVLYEMLAGRRPFRGDAPEVVVASVRSDEPPPLRQIRPDIPSWLERVVDRCLMKDSADRFASAEDVLAALRHGDAGHEASDERIGLVVLPFVNLSSDPETEYFSDGLTEEVIADLSHVRALRVISRTSAMRLKGSEREVRVIARELGVRYALEGAVRKSGDALRISVRLIDAPSESVAWSQKLDGAVGDVFDLQEHVARSIVEALRLHLSPDEARALAARPIPNVRAFESYLRARYEAYRFSKEGLDRATRYIETALALVGDNELLYSTLGHITAMYVEAGIAAGSSVLGRIDALAEQVFALNPRSARGHWLKVFSAFYRGNMHEAVREGEQALRLEPRAPDTLLLLGYVYVHVGRTADAGVLFERARRIDPLTPLAQVMPGCVAVFEGRFADAVEPYRRGFAMEPDSPFGAMFYGWALAYARRTDEAISVLHETADRFPTSPFAALARSLAYALEGKASASVEAVTPALEGAARGSEMFARELCHCYALAGETETALDWLEHAVGLGLLNHDFVAVHDWFLDGLRGTARFRAVLDRIEAAHRTA